MSTDHYLDGVLQVWGDRLFYSPVQRHKAAKSILGSKPWKTSKGAGGQGGSASGGSTEVRRKLDATLRKTPEVVIKISGSGKNIKQIKHHMDYISRNGDIELESQDGTEFHGKDAVRDLHDQWKDGKYVIPTEEGTKRESFNIVLSMPPGTDRQSVKNAVRDFAKVEFGGRFDYVFAAHNDEQHPHVHLVVKARGYDGKRLNPRKADLQSWRESFAERLREHGIEANATKRPTRGITKVPKRQAVIHMKKRGQDLNFVHESDHNPTNPFAGKAAATRKKVIKAYAEMAKVLARSDLPEDRAIALEVVNLVRAMPATKGIERTSPSVVEQNITRKGKDRE